MRTRYPISLLAVTAAIFLVTTWFCRAGEVIYLETFETNLVSDQISTAVSNGVLRAWATLPGHNPANALRSLRSLNLPQTRPRAIKEGRDLELRVDILRVTGDGGYAVLGWREEGIPAIGYAVLVNAKEVALVKHRFDQQILSPFFWEALPVINRPMRVFFRFRMMAGTLSLQVQVLDLENPSQLIFDKTLQDSSDREPFVATPPPLQMATPDPGPPWQGTGFLQLSLFGANTTTARLEMEADNFGARQTQEVTAEDCVELVYTNAANQTLPCRLFVPRNQEPGVLYPLVLGLHGGDVPGVDNTNQFYPEYLLFVSSESQARHPCFLVAPQMPAEVYAARGGLAWSSLGERVVGLIHMLQTQYPIDSDRIYIVGGSLGGAGTWMLVTDYPDLFAAAVPISGWGYATPQLLRPMMLVPIWAFHGAKDDLVPPDTTATVEGRTAKASRGLISDLRHYGACPIYTEYAWPGHGIFGVVYQTPGLADWLMAQRRGQRIRRSPWIDLTSANLDGVLTTSYTNLDLVGTACADAGITNAVWRNETINRSGTAIGKTSWIATGIPLRIGRISGPTVIAFTNVVTVTATGTSWSELYGGTTTFNAGLQVVHIPIRLRATAEGEQTRLDWTGAAPSFVVQHCTDLSSAEWGDLPMTSGTNLVLPHAVGCEFYRIKLP